MLAFNVMEITARALFRGIKHQFNFGKVELRDLQNLTGDMLSVVR